MMPSWVQTDDVVDVEGAIVVGKRSLGNSINSMIHQTVSITFQYSQFRPKGNEEATLPLEPRSGSVSFWVRNIPSNPSVAYGFDLNLLFLCKRFSMVSPGSCIPPIEPFSVDVILVLPADKHAFRGRVSVPPARVGGLRPRCTVVWHEGPRFVLRDGEAGPLPLLSLSKSLDSDIWFLQLENATDGREVVLTGICFEWQTLAKKKSTLKRTVEERSVNNITSIKLGNLFCPGQCYDRRSGKFR